MLGQESQVSWARWDILRYIPKINFLFFHEKLSNLTHPDYRLRYFLLSQFEHLGCTDVHMPKVNSLTNDESGDIGVGEKRTGSRVPRRSFGFLYHLRSTSDARHAVRENRTICGFAELRTRTRDRGLRLPRIRRQDT